MKKFVSVLLFILRYVLMFFWFMLVGIFIQASFKTNNGWLRDIEYLIDSNLLNLMATLLLIPTYYTVTRTFAITEKGFSSFVKQELEDVQPFSTRAKAVLRSPFLYAEVAIVFVLIAVFPKLDQISSLFPKAFPSILINLLLFAAAFAISLLARISAARDLCYKADFEERKFGRGDKKYGFGYFIGNMLVVTFVAPLSSVLVFYIVSAVAIVLGISAALTVISFAKFFSIVAIVAVIVVFTRVLPFWSKRRKFVKKLRRVCRENGCKLENESKMYLSAFFLYEGYNFTLTVDGKRYDCKLVAGQKRTQPMYFLANGEMIRVKKRAFKFLGMFTAAGGAHLKSIDLSHKMYSMNFGFEAEGKKMVIINPVPFNVFAGHPNSSTPLGPGQPVGEYKIYNATGFINAIERNCLDR